MNRKSVLTFTAVSFMMLGTALVSADDKPGFYVGAEAGWSWSQNTKFSLCLKGGAVPDTSIFPDVPGHYLGFSMLMVRLGADGTLEIMGNVPPDFETFAKVTQRC